HLRTEGVPVHLVANPSRTGWTVAQAIEHELPVFKKWRPDFATLLIGINDWVRGSGRNKFTRGLRHLMDRMLEILPSPDRLIVLTLPDLSCAPRGERYGYGRNIRRGVVRYNAIIRTEAEKRNLPVVDLFPLSQTFCGRPEMFVEDGIHPAAGQYAEWEKLIFPLAYRILNQ
ncbi:MAG: hypothetical protein GWM98_03570, partial [Nitrospinaceae bacterium]|nr:hypothetical protein [Nitrospinaceae bacterium]NIS84163.1 hypothetical protein [Nitrospinaceae bacterium]NIT80966.1 hypothetical protein [Nitrospinaceae bacterium]NIU95360.1 hypothetical protein [Nitrospinaceae bacterium]NIY14014.1 hypothetical protein [Nitrospinaceae bacterium]